MVVNYEWVIEEIGAKKNFADKNNILRENVINRITLAYVGKSTLESGKILEEKEVVVSRLSLIDLSDFKPYNEFSKDDILNMALNALHPAQKQKIERMVKSRFDDIQEESNLVTIILNDE